MPEASQVRVGERLIRITNPEKVLFPGDGTTKADLIDYYLRIAPLILPLLAGRPVTRKRWPHGTASEPFFTKNLDSGTPDWVPRARVAHHERTFSYPLVQDEATLVWLGQMASIELHVPQWRLPAAVLAGTSTLTLDGDATKPDRLVVDLDPGPGVGLEECCEVALAARAMLEGAGLSLTPVTSGSKGLHLYADLDGVSAADASAVAAELAQALAAELPAVVVTQMKRALREGKVFVDYTQNNAAKTTVSPYSVRGRERAWVAAPRTWEEVEAGGLSQLLMHEVLERASLEGGESVLEATSAVVNPAQAERMPAPVVTAKAPSERKGTHQTMLAASYDPFAHATMAADRWAFEPKWDGYRALIELSGAGVRLRGRSGRDLTPEFRRLAQSPEHLAGHSGVLDAEIVALENDRPNFRTLQEHAAPPVPPLRLLVFDVLELDGVDLTSQPWNVRREVLEALDLPLADPAAIGEGDAGWLLTPLYDGDLAAALHASSEVAGEGVMAKRRDSQYGAGKRSPAWVKIKHEAEVRVVIGGWRPGQGRREGGIGSLLMGVRADDGTLRYVGKVGTGFSDAELDRLLAALEPLSSDTSPFDTLVPAAEVKVARWVRPELEGEVTFDSWTPDRVLRFARWRGQA